MILDGFLAHDFINVLFPLGLRFAEFLYAFAQRTKQLRYLLGSEEQKYDEEYEDDFPAAKVTNEGECGIK